MTNLFTEYIKRFCTKLNKYADEGIINNDIPKIIKKVLLNYKDKSYADI